MFGAAIVRHGRAIRPVAQLPLYTTLHLAQPFTPTHNNFGATINNVPVRELKQVAIRRRKKRVRYMKRQRDHAKRERQARTWRVVRGDRVFVYGKEVADETGGVGKEGIVARIDRLRELAFVTGVNEQQTSRVDPDTGEKTTGTKVVPVHYDSLRLVDPKDGQPTKSRMRFDEDGYKYRESVRTGEQIPWPEPKPAVHETYERDTLPEDVMEVTYQGR